MKQTDTVVEPDAPRADDRATEKRVLEALIFIADAPLTVEQIAQILPGRAHGEIRELVEELEEDLRRSDRALRVEEVAGGFRFATRSDLAPWIRTHFRHRNRARLSAAGVETLAVIAYKQPITAPEIQEIRGVDSQGAIRTLIEKKLVRTAGRKKVVGRPFLYATSKEFLMHFGLAAIDDLPPIEDFERLASDLAEVAADTAQTAEESLATVPGDIEGAGHEEDGLPATPMTSGDEELSGPAGERVPADRDGGADGEDDEDDDGDEDDQESAGEDDGAAASEDE